MTDLTPKAEHEMDLMRRRSKAYGESINPKEPDVNEMVGEHLKASLRRDQQAVKILDLEENYKSTETTAWLAIQDVLAIIKDDVRQAITNRIGGK